MKHIRLISIVLLLFLTKPILGLTNFDFSGKLQSNSVYSIIQDGFGFLWINYGTGLAKFDGYSAGPVFMPKSQQSMGLIYSIQKDKSDRIFVLTDHGLFLYDYVRHTLKIANPELSDIHVVSVKADNSGNFWVATFRGLFHFDENFNLIKKIDRKNGLSSERINSIFIDKNNHIWVGTENGLEVIVNNGTGFTVKLISKGYRTALVYIDNNDLVWHCRNEEVYVANSDEVLSRGDIFKNVATNAEAISIIERRNEIWIGTRGSGILKYRISNGSSPELLEHTWVRSDNKNEISNTILSHYEDNFSNVWIGTLDGLFLHKYETKSPFNFIRSDFENSNTPSHNTISSIYCDSDNNVWLATANGINKFTRDGSGQNYSIQRYYDNSSDAFRIRNNKIQTIVEWKKNEFLISTKSTLKFFDAGTGAFREDKNVNDTLHKYQMKYVRSSFLDENGDIWLAFSEGGVGILNKSDEILYRLNLNEMDDSDIHRAILKDDKGNIWLSSEEDGLYRITTGKEKHRIEEKKLYELEVFENNLITCLYEDHAQNIWVGTVNGIYKHEPESDKFVKQNLPFFNNEVYVNGIIEDQFNNIWVTSLRGVLRLSERIESRHYEPNPLADYSKFMYITGLEIDKTGTIFIGGVNGLIYFNPTDVYSDSYPLRTVVSNFYIMNQPYYTNGKQTDKDINLAERITLSHKDRQFSFEFSALYYPNPMNIKYAYMLEGYDKDWIYTDSYRRYASYSNLSAGKYTFKVKSTSVPGVWNQEVKEIPIKILPPPWLSWWAYLLYLLVLGAIGYLIYRLFFLDTKMKIEAEQSQSKIRSFINLSYGMKTPLTLLYAPLQHLMKNYETIKDDEAKTMLHLMGKNVKKLSAMISMMMEYRKIDLSKHTLNLSKIDFIKFVDEFCKSFHWQAKLKDIDFKLNTNINEVSVVIDTQKMEVILFNLLENAFKNTPNGGKISVNCELDTQQYKLLVDVIDSGRGIPKEKLEQIFERFQHSGDQTDYVLTGSGIGLSLVKDYIELHHSRITVESTPDTETKFSFFIPLGQSHYSEEELRKMTENKDVAKKSVLTTLKTTEESLAYSDESDTEKSEEKETIFFYTTDKDLYRFTHKLLKNSYNCLHIEETYHLVDEIRSEFPAVILIHISGVMDRKTLDVCRRIKEDSAINMLPLIIIYSVTDPDEKAKIFEIEADGYVEEPFEISILENRIDKVIASREKIKEHIRKELITNPLDSKIISNDDVFLSNLMRVIEENMTDSYLLIDELAEKMNVSRSVFYRKMNQLTNQSPTEFVRTVKLNRAKQLLTQTSYNVSEISEMVGFSDTRHFSRSFKKQFGVSPKQYSIQNKK